MNGTITITLKSDLCPGSGYGYQGIIDQDVSYTSAGLPYIPARRLKGCMREAAVFIGIDLQEIERLFGRRGSHESGALRIGNAYLTDSENPNLEEACRSLIDHMNISKTDILNEFTSVRAQTKLNETTGAPDENTLRYTRIINHYSPLNNQETIFTAECSAADGDCTTLSNIALAVRNIGMHRNRGLGSVRCVGSFIDSKTYESFAGKNTSEKEPRKIIPVVLRNEEALILADKDDQETQTYIPAKALIGALASTYLKNGGNADSEEFRHLFLDGTVTYGNAYPAFFAENAWHRSVPAPLYLTKLKKTEKLVNQLTAPVETDKTSVYYPADGNQPKQLKGNYIVEINPGNYVILEPSKRVDYHHSKLQKSADGKHGILYTSEVLEEHQFFMTQIEAPESLVSEIQKMFAQVELKLGKSRSAEYGRCKVVVPEPWDLSDAETDTMSFAKGDRIAVTLNSDSILIGTNGYTSTLEETRAILKELLKIQEVEENDTLSRIQACTISGFNSVKGINMRKQTVPAVQAGSVYVFTTAEDIQLAKHRYLGERNVEGYGEVEIQKVDSMNPRPEKQEAEPETTSGCMQTIARLILKKKLMDYLIDEEIRTNRHKTGLNPTQIGRVTLMLRESMEMYSDTASIVEELDQRIHSIKTEDTKKKAARLLKGTEECNATLLEKDLQYAGLNLKELYEEIRPQYLLNILTIEKYGKKAGR